MERNSREAQGFIRHANGSLANAVDTAKRVKNKVVAVEEMSIVGKKNSRLITLKLKNTSDVNEYDVPFGTPVGIADEYLSVPFATTIPNIMFNGLADMEDNQGAGLTFMQLLNKRFVRKPVFVSHIQVIAPDTAKGKSQLSESVVYFDVPYNSATDSSVGTGAYIPVYTEYTAVNILGSGVMVGEFNGFYYKMLTSSEVTMNIHLAAIDTPTFQFKH